jgi:hypothetical protein
MYPASDGNAGLKDPLRPDNAPAGIVPEGVLAPEPEFGVPDKGVNSPNGLWCDMVAQVCMLYAKVYLPDQASTMLKYSFSKTRRAGRSGYFVPYNEWGPEGQGGYPAEVQKAKR